LPPEVYTNLAEERGWRITRVLETHIHADHLSRSRQLAELSGATLFLPEQNRVRFRFEPVSEGKSIEFGGARVVALQTPGHTAESTCYLINGLLLITGDTLFLDAFGRTDLHANPEETPARAQALYRSVKRLFEAAPRETFVLPGHTGRPPAFDGKPISAPLSEVRERVANMIASEEDFVRLTLARASPTPPNYQRVITLNEQGLLPEGDPTDLEAGANRCAAG